MLRRPLPHLACFVLAALTAYTGLATAGVERLQRPGRSLAPFSQEPPEGPPGLARSLDRGEAERWQDQIRGRLEALAERQPTAAVEADAAADAAAELRRRLRVLAAESGARLAIHVRDLDDERPLFDHAGDERLNPASNHKLVTAIAATELLGADYRFETRVERDGDTLYLIGEGDPSLQARDLYDLAGEVLVRGAAEGARRIVVDEGAFSREHLGPGYRADDEGASYQAPSGALSLAFNTVEVTVTPGAYGEAAAVAISPASAAVEVVGEVRTGRGRALRVTSERGEGGRTRIRVSGSLRAGAAPQTIRRRVSDPGLFAGAAFAAILAERSGDEALPVGRGEAPADAELVATHTSAPLAAVLASALKYSNNFTTEQVLRTLGWRASGAPGSWENGAAAIRGLWAAIGNAPEDLVFENGSGLSARGRIAPRALVNLLALTRAPGSDAAELLPAFASPGGEGTLRLRMPRAQGRVRGKTGTIGGVSALSGVVTSDDGQRAIAFSILMNGRQDLERSRRLQDRLVLALVDHLDRG
ncbi:MAG: D-alanyl-D-alanine carboxypeptidase/D-alanyl-D-alanine-endopeptidase [Myxococcales bacterium]|nr:D-alanyl-D-alanine carboxypeptidase/D-alanyl-D-alanine-endopeptidase [Myxococcales bacterium]